MSAAEPDRDYRLNGDEALAAGIGRVAAGRAAEAADRLAGIRSGEADAADAVHGARKDLKKLLAVLRLLDDALPKRLRREEAERYRAAARSLSGARDAEVKVRTLAALAAKADDLPAEALDSWRRILERDREAARASLDEAGLAEALELIEAGRAAIEAWPLEDGSWRLVGGGLTRTYGRGRRAMRAAAEGGGEADFHSWRKRAKDLWYALRLLGEAWPEVLDPTAEEAHRLGEDLGDHHDLAVLRADLHERRLGEEETTALESAVLARQGHLAAAALARGERLYAESPKAFGRRLRGYWRAWRRLRPVDEGAARG